MKRTKRKKKLKVLRLFFLLLVLYIIYKCINFSLLSTSKYKVIAQNYNKNYIGIGQEQVSGKDGYFSTFTTENSNKKTYIEYKQNGNASWSKNEYWGGTMEENGCGITAMSIILSGYNKNYTPEDLRKKYFPVLNYENLSNEFKNTFGIQNSDFYYDSVHRSKENIIAHLSSNRPIIICVLSGKNSNRWTSKSHYMALLATDNNDMVYVSNPNGLKNDNNSSGWYNLDEVIPYIAKILYIEDY